jgi:transketolase
VGEDGPTHQPIEQLAMLRSIPNVLTFRPADSIETAECYEIALNYQGPSTFALSRQDLPVLRTSAVTNQSSKGAYVLYEPSQKRDITLIATGSEVWVAMAAKDLLEKQGIASAVVSMPCMELFEQQSKEYRRLVLGFAPKLAIEAASPFGWHKWIGDNGEIIALPHFGTSAPGKLLFEKFGFTPDYITQKAIALVKGQ